MDTNKDDSSGTKVNKQKVISNIIDNYKQLETSIVNQLFFAVDNHGTTAGSNREEIWKSLFEQIVPKKFKVERSVFIIDSTFNDDGKKTGVSNEVDIVIYDDSYTPYIFQYGLIKFIPIEAVAVAIECKSTSLNIDTLSKWVYSIQSLKTSSNSVTRLAHKLSIGTPPTQTATTPLLITCTLLNRTELVNLFDIVLLANKKKSEINVLLKTSTKNNLVHYYYYMNHQSMYNECVKCGTLDKLEEEMFKNTKPELNSDDKKKLAISIDDYRIKNNNIEVSLLSLNFMLNQILMLLNNPMLFPHIAYVNMFNKVYKN